MRFMDIHSIYMSLILMVLIHGNCLSQSFLNENDREVINLKKDWKFTSTEIGHEKEMNFDDSDWETIRVPHDWAVTEAFDGQNDVQSVMVKQDGEKKEKLRRGRTGGLPHIGVGWYRKTFDIPSKMNGKKLFVEFDGAMSHAKVFLNGKYVGERPYGYVSFGFELTPFMKYGEENVLAVRLENFPSMSRWYPGAGIYRNVRLVYTNQTYVKKWGTHITTPNIKKGIVNIKTKVINANEAQLLTEIISPDGKIVASQITMAKNNIEQFLRVKNPIIWDIENPEMYTVLSKVVLGNKIIDEYKSTFGFREIAFIPDDGFHLNGKRIQINGVCMHHDLGPIGTAFNLSAAKRQLKILKQMGCNAIRTSHNMPAPEYINLCDTMGFLVVNEAFDEWKKAKTENGYNMLFDEWAEKDLIDFIHRDRNQPSVIMWSLGNEIPEQRSQEGVELAKFLVGICHREDPSRSATIGMNNSSEVLANGFADVFDVKGFNYHPDVYEKLDAKKNSCIIASETASTVSSRGYYDFPAIPRKHYQRLSLQCSSYDMEYPRWANSPDKSFAILDDYPRVAGEFVWTGFDYLGEPSPYNSQWPTKNSYFGIIDFCGFPKDRYYLYQSRWAPKSDVLHILPHWNWEGREGKITPVHVYTSYESAELFVNGKSYGVQKKSKDSREFRRYRLIWDNVIYQPGEIKVVALDKAGEPAKQKIVKTTGKPKKIVLTVDRIKIKADGEDLAYVTAEVVDVNGLLCPTAQNELTFRVTGAGFLRATGNGNSSDITPFKSNKRKLYNGKCLVIINAGEKNGYLTIEADGLGMESGIVELKVE